MRETEGSGLGICGHAGGPVSDFPSARGCQTGYLAYTQQRREGVFTGLTLNVIDEAFVGRYVMPWRQLD